MPTEILKSYIQVGNRLDQLGTSRELLLEVVNAAVAARTECTENDPSGSRGWRSWQMGTRRSREVHLPLGEWERDNTDQVPSVINARLGVRIVVCNTDDGTCIEDSTPQNRSKKGSATDRAVDNNQLSLFDHGLVEPSPTVVKLRRKESDRGLLTYYLCIFHEGEDIRAELSCAVETSGGYFELFVERIFVLGGETGTGEPIKRKTPDEDGGTGFDIPVTRKK